jgi:hypothetical protein
MVKFGGETQFMANFVRTLIEAGGDHRLINRLTTTPDLLEEVVDRGMNHKLTFFDVEIHCSDITRSLKEKGYVFRDDAEGDIISDYMKSYFNGKISRRVGLACFKRKMLFGNLMKSVGKLNLSLAGPEYLLALLCSVDSSILAKDKGLKNHINLLAFGQMPDDKMYEVSAYLQFRLGSRQGEVRAKHWGRFVDGRNINLFDVPQYFVVVPKGS